MDAVENGENMAMMSGSEKGEETPGEKDGANNGVILQEHHQDVQEVRSSDNDGADKDIAEEDYPLNTVDETLMADQATGSSSNMNKQVDVLATGENNEESISIDKKEQTVVTTAVVDNYNIIGSFHDHFTLPAPSSTVRFRSSNMASRVYESKYSQFIIEEDSNGKVTTKRMKSGSSGLHFLRAVYTLVVLFWTGFLVVFCVQVLLFLIQDLTIQVGATSSQASSVGEAMGTILALPIYIHGLASALVIAGHYAMDTWGGFSLIKKFVFGSWSNVATSWITFCFFLGLPLFIMAVCLLIGTDDWWTITSLLWFSFVAVFYVFFAMTVVYFELNACLEITKNQFDDDDDSFLSLLKRSILLRQVSRYSGKCEKVYIARGELADATGVCNHVDESNARYNIGWYTKLTQWNLWTKLGLFVPSEEPGERMYTVEDALAIRPYVTRASWSLEKLYCRPRNSRYVAVISGPSAITRAQMRSSFVCAILGNVLIFLLLVAALVYLGIGGGFVALICILVAIFWVPSFRSTFRIWALTKDIVRIRSKDNDSDTTDAEDTCVNEGESEGVYQVWETYRVRRATNRLCWIMLFVEWALFFVYPMFTLFWVRNYKLAVLFVVIAAFSAVRYYLNAPVVLEEVGSMQYVRGGTDLKTWENRSRLYDVVTNVTRSRSRGAWNAVLSLFIFVFLALFLGAIGQHGDTSSDQQLVYLPDFAYEQEDDLRYPTCVLGKEIEGGPSTKRLADYAYLATVAYRDTSITQNELDQWFGNDVAVDLADLVTRYRARNAQSDTAVSYKLISFPNATDKGDSYAVVSIRGTTNAWDMLADAQLWSAAACMQLLRAILPIGEIWTPILSQLVNAISFFESANIERVSFYKETTAFVKEVQESGVFKNVQVVGHSLGGGLAIITGAQTGAPAVALSGPNALISRLTFDGVTKEKLDKKVFNIIPDRDPVAHIDDVAELHQNIACTAPSNDFVGCHFGLRSLCEIIHTCGTGNRPAFCECVTQFGYPEPRPIGSRTFAEACLTAG